MYNGYILHENLVDSHSFVCINVYMDVNFHPKLNSFIIRTCKTLSIYKRCTSTMAGQRKVPTAFYKEDRDIERT